MSHNCIPTLLVTPNEELPSSLFRPLWFNGFVPLSIAPSLEAALELFHQVSPSLVLLDLQISPAIVVDLCLEMRRAQPQVKLVLVTEAGLEPPVAVFRAGVSGCIQRDTPPSAWQGLLATIMIGGTVFSRCIGEPESTAPTSRQKHSTVITIGALQIDLERHWVLFGEQRIQLTPREFALLTCLARNPDDVVTFDHLLNDAWGYGANEGTPAQVRLYVARLRRKLIEEAHLPDFILTERGTGYRLLSAALVSKNLPLDHAPPHVQPSSSVLQPNHIYNLLTAILPSNSIPLTFSTSDSLAAAAG